MIQPLLKPKDIKKVPVAVKVFRDGREVCQPNAAGRAEYIRRRRVAWELQNGRCSIGGEALAWENAVTDHRSPRGAGGGWRDDSQANIGAACVYHNSLKGGKRNYQLTP